MDETFLSNNQKNCIRIWAQMIRTADEERAVRILTKIVRTLAGDTLALDAALAATKNEPTN